MNKKIKVNLIARDNGFGLTRDIEILKSALVSNACDVHVTRLDQADERRRWKSAKTFRAKALHFAHAMARRSRKFPFDINIMFEHLWPEHLPQARYNVALPNPEWFDEKDLKHLKCMDRIWCKTRHAQELFSDLGLETSFTSFDSADNYEPSIPREKKFFHLAGGSTIKGTERLLSLWRKHPTWPMLTVLQHPDRAHTAPPAANITHRTEYLSYAIPEQARELRWLQNSHRYHICTSETDGWGHYAIEALGIGAIVIATDAPPMNELITANRGALVAFGEKKRMGLATTYFFDERALEKKITEVLGLPAAECDLIGQRARAWFLSNHIHFSQRVSQALQETLRTHAAHPSTNQS